jgi:hypothetical protein
MRRWRALGWLLFGLGAWASSSCAPVGFQSASLVNSVRILAGSADQPYAKPGATVNVQALAVDERPVKTTPMTLYWLPVVCMNPPNDAYYACFSAFADALRVSGADGGADAAIAVDAGAPAPGSLPTGVDLARFLPTGPSFQFTMRPDAVVKNPTPPRPTPYGLAIVFNIACAGHIELLPLDRGNVQSAPFGCFDAQRNQLGPNDYVFGFFRVYAYDQITNANPVIDHVEVEGQSVDVTKGFQTPHCSASTCPTIHIGPVVPASSQEVDLDAHGNPFKDANGNPRKEEIWADFFTSVGLLNEETRLLYNPTTGLVGSPSVTDAQFLPPHEAGDGFIWIIVHDNRGGATWVTVPVHVL